MAAEYLDDSNEELFDTVSSDVEEKHVGYVFVLVMLLLLIRFGLLAVVVVFVWLSDFNAKKIKIIQWISISFFLNKH